MFRLSNTIIIVLVTLFVTSCVTTTNGRSLTPNKSKAHDAHLNLGLTYLQRDNRESSRRHFEKALAAKPDSAAAHNGLAMLYELTGESELAEKSFKRSLKEDSGFTQARLSYGRFLYAQKRYPEALEVFAKASEDISFPQRAQILTHLGQAALKLGNRVKARSSFEHAVNINNKLTLVMIELGDLYFDEKEYAKSKKYLDLYSELAGRSARSLWLGIRIERIFGNKDKEASYSLALRNLHPYSQEYLEYKKELQNNQ